MWWLSFQFDYGLGLVFGLSRMFQLFLLSLHVVSLAWFCYNILPYFRIYYGIILFAIGPSNLVSCFLIWLLGLPLRTLIALVGLQ